MTAEKNNSEDTQISNYVPNFNDLLVQVLVGFFFLGKKKKSRTREKSIYLPILKPENGELTKSLKNSSNCFSFWSNLLF